MTHLMGINVSTRARTLVAALALASALLSISVGPAAAVAEPSARLQVVVKSVKIHDDREGFLSGLGEMRLLVAIWNCPDAVPLQCEEFLSDGPGSMVYAAMDFKAGTGDTVTFDRLVPQAGDKMSPTDGPHWLGFPIRAGSHQEVRFRMSELDEFSSDDDEMGRVQAYLDTAEHGLGIGEHTARSVREDGVSPGDYTITWEIRRAPLPDVRPTGIKLHDLIGSAKKLACMAVVNSEISDAGPFEVALKLDGVVPPGGRAAAGRLASGDAGELCVEVALPTSGQHTLAAVVDEPRALAEFNETNNVYEQPYLATGPVLAPTPSAALPDLTVSEIRINGQVPDGKDDCKDGKNAVAVVVKNLGKAKAGDFYVGLVVDNAPNGADSPLLVEDGLDASKEVTVTFSGVRLKKGQHSLTAIADATTGTGIEESNEGNNTLTITARCSDDD